MPRPRGLGLDGGGPGPGRAGFSMVEMLVAMVFMGILMAGVTAVFKASISAFYIAGEKSSSTRRNRQAMDLLYEDINSAGMFIGDLTSPPQNLGAGNPLFYILPNQPIAGYLVNGQQQYGDQLFFYMDQPLPFLGVLQAGSSTYTDAQGIVNGAGPQAADNTFIVTCGAPASTTTFSSQVYSALLQGALNMCFMDQWQTMSLAPMAAAPATSTVTVVTVPDPASGYLSRGASISHNVQHTPGSSVLFYVPRQMVRYSIQMLGLDPLSPGGIPCLVRDQGTYNPGGFNATLAQQVITENVQKFKVYLSANPGYLSVHNPTQAWAPFNAIANNPSLAAGWTNGILADLNTQLAASGRSGAAGTSSNAVMTGNYAGGLAWFRIIPAVVRLDITTQTATQRSEFSANGQTLANAALTRSLIIEPRNFGLPLD